MADADGLHDHPVIESTHQHHGAQGHLGQPAQPVARGHGAHKEPVVRGIGRQTGTVPEQGPAGTPGGGIDSDHPDTEPSRPETVDESPGQGGLANPRRPGQADDLRLGGLVGIVEQPQRTRVLRRALQQRQSPRHPGLAEAYHLIERQRIHRKALP